MPAEEPVSTVGKREFHGQKRQCALANKNYCSVQTGAGGVALPYECHSIRERGDWHGPMSFAMSADIYRIGEGWSDNYDGSVSLSQWQR